MSSAQPYRLIISGGGTGGHIFPAIAIANAFRQRHPDAEILFVGAEGRMEMTRVPDAGYKIIGLNISGIQRSLSLKNLMVPFRLIASVWKARKIVREFKPHVAVGTGGYASGPLMIAATARNVPSLLQEQNSYAGLTNKQLAGKVQRICVAYNGMEKYFPANKIKLTGNPVRKDIATALPVREKAIAHFGLRADKPVLLVLGGSLGARTINQSIMAGIDTLAESGIQVIWQSGRMYYDAMKSELAGRFAGQILLKDFLKEMDMAYAAADIVVSRAGALSISELCLVRKPVILVPSPNVAEDHQTRNAEALVKEGAAVMIADRNAVTQLVPDLLDLIRDAARCEKLSQNIGKLAKPAATDEIVSEIEQLIK